MGKTARTQHARMERAFKEGLIPKAIQSDCCFMLAPSVEQRTAADLDFKQCLELGAMIMLNKPIITMATRDGYIPPGLRRVSHVVIDDVDIGSEEGMARAQQELTRLLGLDS